MVPLHPKRKKNPKDDRTKVGDDEEQREVQPFWKTGIIAKIEHSQIP